MMVGSGSGLVAGQFNGMPRPITKDKDAGYAFIWFLVTARSSM